MNALENDRKVLLPLVTKSLNLLMSFKSLVESLISTNALSPVKMLPPVSRWCLSRSAESFWRTI